MKFGNLSTLAAAAAVSFSLPTLVARAGDIDDKNIVDDKTVTRDTGITTDSLGKFSRSRFHVSVSLRGGYDDNVLTTTVTRKSSWFTNGAITVSYKAGNPRTQVDLAAGGGMTYYFDRPGGREYDFNGNLGLSITHKATPRLTLAASVYATYQAEPDFSLNVGLNRRSGNYFYTVDKFAAAFQWAPRFSTVTSYTFGIVNYESSDIGAFEDRFEHTFANEFRFLLLPTTSLIGDYRFMVVDYDTATRDSTTHFLLAGVDHSFNPRFNLSVRGGVEFRSYEGDNDRSSPYFEGAVNYAVGPRTSVSWTNRYSIEEPDVPGAQSRTTFRTGLQLLYGITPRISARVGAFYQHDENEAFIAPGTVSPEFTEDAFDLALGIRYNINRNWSLEAGYNHIEVLSDVVLREYSRNRYFLGVAYGF